MNLKDLGGYAFKTGLITSALVVINTAIEYIEKDSTVSIGLIGFAIVLVAVAVYLIHLQVKDMVKIDILKELSK